MKKSRILSYFRLALITWLLCLSITACPAVAAEQDPGIGSGAETEAVPDGQTTPAAETGTAPGEQATPAAETTLVSLSGTSDFDKAFEVLRLTNILRAEGGLEPLVMDMELLTAAMQRAGECALYFEHTRPNGTPCFTVSDRLHGENIEVGYNSMITAEQAVTGWRNSPGHYANIMTPEFRSIGIGHVTMNGCSYWTQSFSYYEAAAVASNETLCGAYPTQYRAEILVADARLNLQLTADKTTLTKGKSAALQLSYRYSEPGFPDTILDFDLFTLTSSAPEILSVDNTGRLQAISVGTATITAVSRYNPAVAVSLGFTVTDPDRRTIKLYAQKGNFPGGETVQTLYVTNNEKYGALPSPVRKGYTFVGWFDSADKQVRPSTKVSINQKAIEKLYAKWKKITVGQAAVMQASGKKKKNLKVTIRKVNGADGYQVYVSANKKFKKKGLVVAEISAKKKSAAIRHTLKKQYLYVKLRAYKLDSAGNRVYGKFSTVKQVKMK